jgi:hypothetical protein
MMRSIETWRVADNLSEPHGMEPAHPRPFGLVDVLVSSTIHVSTGKCACQLSETLSSHTHIVYCPRNLYANSVSQKVHII